MEKTLAPSNSTFSSNPIEDYGKGITKNKINTAAAKIFQDCGNTAGKISAASVHKSAPSFICIKDKNLKQVISTGYSQNNGQNTIESFIKNFRVNADEFLSDMDKKDRYVLQNKNPILSEKTLTDFNGKENYYKIYKMPVLKDNEVYGIITIIKNLNKEKELENQKETYLAALAHDLKNPLQAQLSSLKMLMNGALGKLNPQQEELIQMIIESGTFMQEILYSLLAVYKYDNGIVELYKNNFDINELIKKCINESNSLAKDRNVEICFATRLKDNEKYIYADETQLRRVITNLINNSISYCYRNTTIQIETKKKFNKLVFGIENSSPEIPFEIKDRIFEKYITGGRAGTRHGTGLGLYYCKKVIETHGGKIYLKSKGANNRFIFEIPLQNKNKSCITLN